jgi:hypothetical protein
MKRQMVRCRCVVLFMGSLLWPPLTPAGHSAPFFVQQVSPGGLQACRRLTSLIQVSAGLSRHSTPYHLDQETLAREVATVTQANHQKDHPREHHQSASATPPSHLGGGKIPEKGDHPDQQQDASE